MATIRTAQCEDIDTIQRVARTTWHATYDGILGPEAVDTKVDEWYDDEIVRTGITNDDTVYLVASDEAVIGYATGGPVDEDGTDVAALHAIYLHPDRWGDGIGSQLFDALTDRLRQRGYDRLKIRVLADNDRARAFYERHSFTVEERQQIELADVTVPEVTYSGPLRLARPLSKSFLIPSASSRMRAALAQTGRALD